jgi:cold shock CspA family protein
LEGTAVERWMSSMSNNGLSQNAQPSNGEGAGSTRRRKIDRSEWPKLLARRDAGATQAQIAQDYGVSQGTVSQILKRARAEAEGQSVPDLDHEEPGEAAAEPAESTAGTDTGAAAAGAPAARADAPASPATGAANDSSNPPARRTLTTRAKTTAPANSETAETASRSQASTQAQTGDGAAANQATGAADTATGGGQVSAGTGGTGQRKGGGNPLADRLREASERCAELVDQKATTDTLSSAVHEVRRALAAIEIDAAKQNSPAAQRPRQQPTPPARDSAPRPAAPERTPEPMEPPRRERDPGLGADAPKSAGRVKFFKPEKGFGFIIPDDGGDDIFIGKDTVQAACIERLSEGERVRYTPGPGAKGLEAKTIERIN